MQSKTKSFSAKKRRKKTNEFAILLRLGFLAVAVIRQATSNDHTTYAMVFYGMMYISIFLSTCIYGSILIYLIVMYVKGMPKVLWKFKQQHTLDRRYMKHTMSL